MVVDLFLVYQFLRRLATPFNKWEAYKLGIIDEKGKVLIKRKDFTRAEQRKAWGIFDIMIANLKKLLAKVPGGGSRLASYAAALYLIKEWNHFSEDSLLTEDISEEQLEESLLLFNDRYVNYIQLAENVNMLNEVKGQIKPPAWKRAGRNGEIEIKFPTGRRFKIEKHLDENERHKGEWKVMEYKTGGWVDDWEWMDTYKPKGYAKQRVMQMGQYDKKGKKVADYSSTFQYESVNKINTKPELEEEPANNVGSGNIAGLGVGPQGEPGMSRAAQKKWTSQNKSKKKRLRDIMGELK